jgi:CMP-N,N'-diacetyllegionaminic acid synthase
MPRVIAIIPARGGSKGLPKKNVRLLAGRPLIAHTIQHALDSGVCDAVLVSTEDEEIAEIARRFGAQVPFLRPADLAQDSTPTEPVLQHALVTYETHAGQTFDIAVFLQPTDIFRPDGVIRECVEKLAGDETLDSAFAAYKTHKNFWRRTPGGWTRLAADLAYGPRQGREPLYREDTGIACATRASFVRAGRRVGDRIELVPNDDPRTFIDIHDEFDMWLAEKVLTEWR